MDPKNMLREEHGTIMKMLAVLLPSSSEVFCQIRQIHGFKG